MTLPAWPAAERVALLRALAERAGLGGPRVALPEEAGAAAQALGLSLEPVHTTYEEVPALVRSAGPALVELADGSLLGLLGVGWLGRAKLLGPDGRVQRVSVAAVTDAIRAALEDSVAPSVDALLGLAGLEARAALRQELLNRRLRGRLLGGVALVRASLSGPWPALARDHGLPAWATLALLARVMASLVGLAGWLVVGGGALQGQLDRGQLAAWLLLVLTGQVLRTASTWGEGELALRAGALVKRLLLQGALRLPPDTWRTTGHGGMLARINEAQVIEDLALSGGLRAVLSVSDVIVAAGVLYQGVAGAWLVGWLLLCLGGLVLVTPTLQQRTLQAIDRRRELADLLLERMMGHRTRLAQALRWYEGEDQALAASHDSVRVLDGLRVGLQSATAFLFPLVALGLVGATFAWDGGTPGAMAVAIGGVLLASGALASVGASLDDLLAVGAAWRQVGTLLVAAREPALAGDLAVQPQPGAVVLRAQGLRFAWPGRSAPLLRDVTLTLRDGDRVWLGGASGGGKSTLVSLLAGLRAPSEGLLLLHGLDPRTWGERRWQRRVATAPQFHDNHIFAGTLAFNLLLARGWPASPGDLQEAQALCEELGLGPLLRAMPSGLQQVVGEAGWQLSHGERSRVFLARALLQGAEVVIVDESFAALDPETFALCLQTACRRARTLVVVAHD